MMGMRTPRSALLRSLLRVIVLLLVVDSSLAHGAHSHHHEDPHQHRSLGTGTSNFGGWVHDGHGRKCGTQDPSDARIARSNEVAHKWLQAKGGRSRALQDDPIVLPICFHVIRPDENNPNFLNTESLQIQLDALNLSFSSDSCCDTSQPWCNAGDCSIETGIRFEMALLDPTDGSWVSGSTTPNVADTNSCATRTVNADWYSSFTESSTELNMKRTLRVGDASVLNVYFKTNDEGILGYATFPDEFTVAGDVDGVIINDATVIGGSSVEYDEGDTLTHEVGHWLGLYHTFQGACEVGDEILDTAAEKMPAFGCAQIVGRDTCSGGGVDPIFNFMDYSDDLCLYTWTEGQIIRVRSQLETYRLGGGSFTQGEDLPLADGVPSDSIDLFEGQVQHYFLEVGGGTRTTCVTSASVSGGDVDLFLRLNAKPEQSSSGPLFDCSSESTSSDETCAVVSPDGAAATVWASVYGYKATQGVTLTCTSLAFSSVIPLVDSVASDPITLDAGDMLVYSLGIASEGTRVTCELVGDNGDLDLFLVFGDEPYIGSGPTACSGVSLSSVETCIVDSPTGASNLFITVQAFAGATNAVLTCFVVATQSTTIALSNGIDSDPVTVEAFGAQSYTLDVPQGTERASCTASAIGEGNIYLRWGSLPDLASSLYDCSDAGFTRACEVMEPPAGETVLWVLVDTFSGLQDLIVSCTSSSAATTSLTDGVTSEPVFLSSIQTQVYTLEVLRGANITCETNATSGDLDLYLGFDQPVDVTTASAECGLSFSSVEVCSVTDPGTAELLYVSLVPYNGPVSDAVVTCTSRFETGIVEPGSAIELVDGVPSEPLSLETDQAQSYTLVTSPNANVVCQTVGDGSGGDADLYMRWGEEPDLELYIWDCASTSFEGSDEMCTVANPGGATVLWATVDAWEPFSGVTIQCTSSAPASLTAGVTSDPFSLLAFNSLSFTLAIEFDQQITCQTTATTVADADLYLRFGAAPDIAGGNYDCGSFDLESDEICSVRNVAGADILWATVSSLSNSTIEGLTITCTAEQPSPVVVLTDGVSFGPFSLDLSASELFSLSVQPGDTVNCQTTATSGDMDIFLRWDGAPTDFIFDCSGVGLSSNENCEIGAPSDASVLYILAVAYSPVVDAAITCSIFEPVPLPLLTLEDGVPSDLISLAAFEVQSFVFSIESNTQVVCETQGGVDGDADLYLRFDALPDISNGIYDCIGFSSTSVESCSLEDQGFAMAVYGSIVPYAGSSFTDLTVTCSSESPVSVTSLLDGIASGPYSLSTGLWQTFVLDVSSITGNVICQTRGDVGDCDLYTRIDEEPDLEFREFGCESSSGTSYEECVVADLDTATSLFVTLYAFSSFSEVMLTCSSYSNQVEGTPLELADGVPSEPFDLNLGQIQNFRLQLTNPPPTGVVCTINADDGDADIYVRLDAEPNLVEPLFDCAGETFTSNEICEVETSGASSVWAQVVAFDAFTNGITTCESVSSLSEPTTPAPISAPVPVPATVPAPAPVPAPVPTSTADVPTAPTDSTREAPTSPSAAGALPHFSVCVVFLLVVAMLASWW